MRTPAGIECPYFYGDYYRGKNREECRLIGNQPPPRDWNPKLCTSCPVPGILRANACTFLKLRAEAKRTLGIFNKHVVVSAYCTKTQQNVPEPHIGCGSCHSIPTELSDPIK